MPIVGAEGFLQHSQLGLQQGQLALQGQQQVQNAQQMALQFAEATRRLDMAEKQFAAQEKQFSQTFAMTEKRYQLDLDIHARESKMKDLQLEQLQGQMKEEEGFKKKAGPFAKGATEFVLAQSGEDEDKRQATSANLVNLLSGMSGYEIQRAIPMLKNISEAAGTPANVWAAQIQKAGSVQRMLDASGMNRIVNDTVSLIQSGAGIDPEQINSERQRTDEADRTATSDLVQRSTAVLQQLGVLKAGADVASFFSGDLNMAQDQLATMLMQAQASASETKTDVNRQALATIQANLAELTTLQQVRAVHNDQYETKMRFQTQTQAMVREGIASAGLSLTGEGAPAEQISAQLLNVAQQSVPGIRQTLKFVNTMFDAPSNGQPRAASAYLQAATPEVKKAAEVQLRIEAKQAGLNDTQIDQMLQIMGGLNAPPTTVSAPGPSGTQTKKVPSRPSLFPAGGR
jgi:hypothetical protein